MGKLIFSRGEAATVRVAAQRLAVPRSASDFFRLLLAFALISTKFSAVSSGGTAGSSCV